MHLLQLLIVLKHQYKIVNFKKMLELEWYFLMVKELHIQNLVNYKIGILKCQ